MSRPPLTGLALALLALTACKSHWREKVDPARAAEDPEQTAPSDPSPIVFEKKGFTVKLTPRADYRIKGYAVETSSVLLDDWDFILPLDVSIAWGPVADPEVMKDLEFHLSRRYVSYWYRGTKVPSGDVARHVSNNHLIPANRAVEKAMGRIRIGDLVTLRGKLVDLEVLDSGGQTVMKAATSLTRDDVGNGACETIYVESAERERL